MSDHIMDSIMNTVSSTALHNYEQHIMSEEKKMNEAWIINRLNLLRDDCVTVHCSFQHQNKTYTYIASKDLNLLVGDCAIVETPRNGYVVVDVKKVDDKLDIDIDKPFEYKWIVDRVNLEEYGQIQDERKAFLELYEKEEREQRRHEAREVFIRSNSGIEIRDFIDNLNKK